MPGDSKTSSVEMHVLRYPGENKFSSAAPPSTARLFTHVCCDIEPQVVNHQCKKTVKAVAE